MDIKERIQCKENILRCARLCGGITGKYAARLCSDPSLLKEMMEDGQIRKIPVEVRMSDKTKKKIFFYEEVVKTKPIQFPNMKEEDAVKISLLNKCYCTYAPSATSWFNQTDINRFAQAGGLVGKLVPNMLFYEGDKMIAVYVLKSYMRLKDDEKTSIEANLGVDTVLEYTF
jgi:hypothetical protein